MILLVTPELLASATSGEGATEQMAGWATSGTTRESLPRLPIENPLSWSTGLIPERIN